MILGRRAYLKTLSDEQIISVFQQKQWTACIEEIYRRYAHLTYGVHLKYVKNHEDAQDLTMDLFLRLPELITKHEIGNFKAWVHRVASNAALGSLRKQKGNHHLPIEELAIPSESSDTDFTIDQHLDLLSTHLDELKQDQKKCIQLFYLEQKSYEQIMIQTGFTFKEVKSHIQNGKRNLRLLIIQNPAYESR